MAATAISPKPTVRIHPRVHSAMYAFANCDEKAKHHRMEKGFLLLGHSHDGGRVVDVEDFVVFPQLGNYGGVVFNDKHPKAGKFWPALSAYLEKSGMEFVGWAHYFSGGSHHSHTDDTTDELLSQMAKEGSPILSMTWNHEIPDKVAIEGKFWIEWSGQKTQLTIPDLPIEFITTDDEGSLERFIEQNQPTAKAEITIEFAPGVRYILTPDMLGLNAQDLIGAAFQDLRKDFDLYLKTANMGTKLREAIRTSKLDQDVIKQCHDQLDAYWETLHYQQKHTGSGNGGGSYPFSTAPATGLSRRELKKLKRRGWASDDVTTLQDEPDSYDPVNWILTESEAETYEPEHIGKYAMGAVLVVPDENAAKAIEWSEKHKRWTSYTVNIWDKGMSRAQELFYSGKPRNQMLHVGLI